MFARYRFLLLALGAAVVIVLCGSVSALALPGGSGGPQWTVSAISTPTNLPAAAGSTGVYTIEVKNTGATASDGSTITVTDALPAGLLAGAEAASGRDFLTDRELSCVGVTCTYTGVVVPNDSLVVKVPVEVAAGAPGSVTNGVRVTGGGAAEGFVETPTVISSTPAGFGIAPGSVSLALSTVQAGAHPDLTGSVAFNTIGNGLLSGDPKEIITDLPPGFVGDVADTPTCPISVFSLQEHFASPQACPLGTQVGTVTLTLRLGPIEERVQYPVYNLAPNPGEVVKFGFMALLFGVQGTVSLRPGDYGIRTSFQNIDDLPVQVAGASLSLWGAPSDPVHDAMRGLVCIGQEHRCEYFNAKERVGYPLGRPEELQPQIAGESSSSPAIPFLTNPTQCTGSPLEGGFSVSSWENPTQFVSSVAGVGPLVGCNLLPFGPAITAAPDTTRGDTPAGFTFEVRVPQEGLVSPEGISTADVENTTATLPVGVVINPGQANGLAACQLVQAAIGVQGPPSCPPDSRVGHVEVQTPVLKNKLEGEVYVMQSNPPDLKLLVAASDPTDGIYVKLQADVHLNESTGQIVTTFLGTPELPFSDFKLSFSGGAQAALATPLECGVYTTDTDFTPWSTPFVADVFPSSGFAIESGPGGSTCVSSPPQFAPSLDAGATTDQAGGFTDFSLLLTREDGQQRISTLQFKTPEGLLGMIARVPLCGEPQAGNGECSAASQIGHTVVEAGPGPYPLVVPQPGQPPAPIYLTGGYKGAPYGLSIVVPLVVGPFNLGTIVVRARIEVDPRTSQLTVTTDPLPSIVDGVPSDLRTINAVIDRPGFMFNPTNCSPMSFSGSATSTEGADAPISSHFQVGSCQSLKFQPDFKVSTSGKTSKEDGASLDAKLVYPTGALGDNQASSQANIAYVKVSLPKQLPSRLTTLQQACTAAQFESNPSGCPAASVVGHAKVLTPVLPVPLEGPAYFVSHGGEAFPSLIVVLQGYGVTVELVGDTAIKNGITSSTFASTPDVPFSLFELTLPEGPYSALTASGDLCRQNLVMPTAFVGQNGATLNQDTHIEVVGCSNALSVVSKGLKGRTLTLQIAVPAAGRLRVSGRGLSSGSKSSTGREVVTIKLHVVRHGRTKVTLSFKPAKGKKLSKALKITA
jgi:uncharacterized repeat protein (TIGR01451 family)